MMALHAALAAEGIRLARTTPGNHKLPCPICSHNRRKRNDPCLSVKVDGDGGAAWNCHHCGWTGNVSGERWRERQSFRRAYRRPTRVANPERPDKLLDWFRGRDISPETVNAAGIYRTRHWFPQISAEADCIAFPYEWAGELRNVKYRDKYKHFAQEKDAEPVLYGADSIGPTTIVVEGEIDVLSFREAGFEHVVSLPNGAPAKQETSDQRYAPLLTHAAELEKVERFYIATDMDEPGERLAQELARRLGKDRCWRVRFPTINDVIVKDANECLTLCGAAVLRECVEQAEPWPIDGLHQVSDYLAALLQLYRGEGPKPLSTNWPELDKAFRILPGQFIVVTGIPNHGKSQWLDQLAVQMARQHGWRWAVFSPEGGSAENHIAALAEIWLGTPFYEGPNQRMTEAQLRIASDWIGEHFTFIDAKDATPTIDWIIARAKGAVLRYGARAVIIDPYNEIEASRPHGMTETEFVSRLISKCKRFGTTHDVTVFMVAHPTKLQSTDADKDPMPGLYDLSGSAHWRNKCDAGLVIYRDFDEGETLVLTRKIRKQPICGVQGAVSFFFNPVTRRYEDREGSFRARGKKKSQALAELDR